MNTMLRRAALVGAGFGVLALGACKMAPADTAKDEAAIKAMETAWSAELASKDADKQAAHYAADGLLVAPGEPPLKGADAIKGAMTQMWKDPNFSLSFAPDEVHVAKSGDLAYTVGHYTETETDPATKAKVTHQGQYSTVYTKDASGQWKAAVDTAFSPTPPAAPAAAATPPAKK